MPNDNPDHAFEQTLGQLQSGSVLDFLRHDGFPAWIELVSASLLQQELPRILDANEDVLRGQFRETQVRRLARRLIISRNGGLFDSLQPLWRAFGSCAAHHSVVLAAIESVQNKGPTEVFRLGVDNDAAAGFSSEHADFVKALRRVGTDDTTGVLGAAIRTSRIVDERLHVGFPLVISGRHGQNLRNGFWVTPTASLPQKLCESLHTTWVGLSRSVDQLTRASQSCGETLPGLPAWLHRLVETAGWNVETLDSAGFGLAIQLLARQADRNLPFGIGFSGRWESEQLRGVRNLAAKARAAKEAGVFLLFACADPDEPDPDVVEGVRIALLPEGLWLQDVVREVNRLCADSGLTEYRWRDSQRRFRAAGAATTAHTPDLPEALDNAICPVGFVGREETLALLQQEISQQHSSRRLLAVIAPARSGKTTLLSRFASQQTPYPIWFSFRRGQASRQNLAQLQDAVCDQMSARFGAVPMPSQFSTGNLSSEDRLAWLVDAISGPVSLFVDGIDEGQSPQDVLNWLQTMPGSGLVVVGSQPLPVLDGINCRPIKLRNDSPSGEEDARALITKFAARFAQNEQLQRIGQQLRQNEWIDGLCERSGGNLWVLTDFLSNVERERGSAGWPASPSEAPLSPDVREYCRILIADALADHEGDSQTRVETFLAFRSYLENRPWRVQDVLRLAGDFLNGAPFGAWGGTGLLASSARRVLEFDGTHCRFWSPLTREAVQNNYMTYAGDVSRRLIDLLQNDESQDDLLDHVTESVPSLLVEVSDAELTSTLLFESPWIHRRTRLLARQRESVGTLRAELASLIPFLPPDRAEDVRRLVEWLAVWGWAIDDSPNLVEQWWDAAGEVMQPFPPFESVPRGTNDKCHLLAPIVGPDVADAWYQIPRTTSPRFHGAVCEVLEGDTSHLVFVRSRNGGPGDLLVFPEEGGRYHSEPPIRLTEAEAVFALASLPYPEVAALVRLPNGGCDVRVFDVRSGQPRTLLADSRIVALETLAAGPARLLVVRRESDDDGPTPCTLCVLDAQGHQVADALLPFVLSKSADIEIVPFGLNCFCVLGHQQPKEPREIRLYRLQSTSGTSQIAEIQSPAFSTVNGACALPNRCLAVTHRGSAVGSSQLSIVHEDGQVELRIPLYASPHQTGSRYSLRHATVGRFLLHCRPVAWHRKYGIILTGDHDRGLYAVQVESEAIPIELPRRLSNAIDTGDSTTMLERVLSINRDRVMFVFSTGAVVVGSLDELVRIEGGCKAEVVTEIVGVRADGHVVICDGFVNPDNEWTREGTRLATPPFDSAPPTRSFTEPFAFTHDGWELLLIEGRTLVGYKAEPQGDVSTFSMDINPANESTKLLDVTSIEDGKFVLAIRDSRGQVSAVVRDAFDESFSGDGKEWLFDKRHDSGDKTWDIRFIDSGKNYALAERWDAEGSQLDNVMHDFYFASHFEPAVPSPEFRERCLLFLGGEFLLDLYSDRRFAPAQGHLRDRKQLEFVGHFWPHSSRLSTETLVLDRQLLGEQWQLTFLSIVQRSEWAANLIMASFDPSCGALRFGQSTETQLRDEVCCWHCWKGYLVAAFTSGRVEFRPVGQLERIAAVAFTSGRPQRLEIVHQSDGTFLVVSDGAGLTWYRLDDRSHDHFAAL